MVAGFGAPLAPALPPRYGAALGQAHRQFRTQAAHAGRLARL